MNVRLIGGPHDGEVAEIMDVTEPGTEFEWPQADERGRVTGFPARYRYEKDGAGHFVEPE
jgi:hypothetical protein